MVCPNHDNDFVVPILPGPVVRPSPPAQLHVADEKKVSEAENRD